MHYNEAEAVQFLNIFGDIFGRFCGRFFWEDLVKTHHEDLDNYAESETKDRLVINQQLSIAIGHLRNKLRDKVTWVVNFNMPSILYVF